MGLGLRWLGLRWLGLRWQGLRWQGLPWRGGLRSEEAEPAAAQGWELGWGCRWLILGPGRRSVSKMFGGTRGTGMLTAVRVRVTRAMLGL